MACGPNSGNTEVPLKLTTENFPQTWQLTSMSGMVAGIPPTTGEDMEWQEQYVLFTDGSFLKSRTSSDSTREEGGTFTILQTDDGAYIEFTYSQDNPLIGNCTNEPVEVLRFKSDTELIGTWWACDGPGLFYTKVE